MPPIDRAESPRRARTAALTAALLSTASLAGCDLESISALYPGPLGYNFEANASSFGSFSVGSIDFFLSRLIFGDYNNNGTADSIFAERGSTTLRLGFGDPTHAGFYNTDTIDTAIQNDAITHADKDDDGDTDLFVAGLNADASAVAGRVITNDETGLTQGGFTLGPVIDYAGVPTGGTSLGATFLDADADGWNDDIAYLYSKEDNAYLATATYDTGTGYSVAATAMYNANAGNFDDTQADFTPIVGLGLRAATPPDIALAINAIDQVWVVPNNGDATYPDGSQLTDNHKYDVGEAPGHVAAADLNNDANPDLITANEDSDDVSVLLNNGDNTFAPEARFQVGDRAEQTAAADFDNDGDLDLAIAAQAGFLLLNNGDATFAAPTQIVEDRFLTEVRAGDFNDDGNADVAFRDGTGKEALLLLGEGDATFRRPGTIATDGRTEDVALADLDADGDQDLVHLNTFPNQAAVRLNNGDGMFAAPTILTANHQNTEELAIADLDLQNGPDIVATDRAGETSIYFNNGDGTFQPAFVPAPLAFVSAPVEPEKQVHAIEIDDLNNDNRPDLALVTGASFVSADQLFEIRATTVINNPDGTWTIADSALLTADPGTAKPGIAVADLNDDDNPELIVAHNSFANPSAPLSVVSTDGSGAFAGPPQPLDSGALADDVDAADIDADGDIDLVIGDGTNPGAAICPSTLRSAVIILRNNGDGTFDDPEPLCISDAFNNTVRVHLADAEGDGDPDIYAADEGFALLLNDGAGNFSIPYQYAAEPGRFTTADANNDGFADVFTASGTVPGTSGNITASLSRAPDQNTPCTADTNNDQTVDLTDLLTVLANFGNNTTNGPTDGDINPPDAPDGTVDLNDLLLVLANFGNTCP
jgi:hypothetical protein